MEPEATPTADISELSQAGDASFERINTPEGAETEAKPSEATPAPAPSTTAPGDNGDGKGDGIDPKTLEDVKGGKLIPHHRFNEVLERSKAYESLGTPEEIRQKLEAVAKKVDAKADAEPEMSLDDEDKAIKDHLLKLFPQLKDMPKKLETLSEFTAQMQKEREVAESVRKEEYEKFFVKADETIVGFAKEVGLPVDDELSKQLILSNIRDILHADEKLRAKFYSEKDLGVLKTAFDDYQKRLFSGVQRKTRADILTGKTKQNALHRPPVEGGSPEKEEVSEASSFDEAGERSFARAK